MNEWMDEMAGGKRARAIESKSDTRNVSDTLN